MDIATYKSNFDGTSINEDTSKWDLSWFLMFGDTKTETVDIDYCTGCT